MKLAQTSETSKTWQNIQNMAKLPKHDKISPGLITKIVLTCLMCFFTCLLVTCIQKNSMGKFEQFQKLC